MIYTFTIYSVETGAPLEGETPEINLLQRTNEDGTVDPLTLPAVTESPEGGGSYSFPIDDSFFKPQAVIDLIVDCGENSAAAFLEDHLRSDLFRLQSVDTVPDSSVELSMKRGDLLPAFERVLRDDRGEILDLSGDEVSVIFRMRVADGGALKVDDAEAEIIGDGKKGRVRYEWAAGDTDTLGLFDAEFMVVDGPRTLPPRNYYRIEIVPNLAD